jgi:hypothetical protein
VDDPDGLRGESLEDTARTQNSNLQRLIDAVGILLAASKDLLARLQAPAQVQPSEETPTDAVGTPDNDESGA